MRSDDGTQRKQGGSARGGQTIGGRQPGIGQGGGRLYRRTSRSDRRLWREFSRRAEALTRTSSRCFGCSSSSRCFSTASSSSSECRAQHRRNHRQALARADHLHHRHVVGKLQFARLRVDHYRAGGCRAGYPCRASATGVTEPTNGLSQIWKTANLRAAFSDTAGYLSVLPALIGLIIIVPACSLRSRSASSCLPRSCCGCCSARRLFSSPASSLIQLEATRWGGLTSR